MKKVFIAVLATLAILVLTAAIGVPVYEYLNYEELDLTPLAKYAETEDIDLLIAQVQSEPVPEEGFKFVALGDTRSVFNVAKMVMAQIKTEAPAFVLSNGDIVRRGQPSEYIAHHMPLVNMLKPIPFITVPGNHEEGPNDEFAAFLAIYGKVRFSFDHAGCRFVGINNCNGFFEMTRDNLRYLDEELGKPGAEHKFVTFHVPPDDFSVYVDSDEGRGFRWRNNAFRKLMEKHKVDQVVMGHIHGFASQVENGVRYTISGGGGATLADRLPDEGRRHGYVAITVTADGVQTESVLWNGEAWLRKTL